MRLIGKEVCRLTIKHVTVSGSGLMGTQIAMQAALSGYETVCYDISAPQLDRKSVV